MLAHIREAINDIEEYTSVGRDRFMADRMRQDAVIRKLEIIGEAVKQLTDTAKQSTRNSLEADRRNARSTGSPLFQC